MISNGHCPIAHYLSESDTIPAMGMKMRLSLAILKQPWPTLPTWRSKSPEFSPKSLDPLPQPNPKQATHGPRQLLHQWGRVFPVNPRHFLWEATEFGGLGHGSEDKTKIKLKLVTLGVLNHPFLCARSFQVSKLMLSCSLQKSLSSVLPKPQGDLPTVKAGVVNAHLDKNIIGVPMDPHKLTFFIPCHPHSDPWALWKCDLAGNDEIKQTWTTPLANP